MQATGLSNLQHCLHDLKRHGYVAVSFMLSPNEIGIPERRQRIFILASLELTLTELQEVVSIVKSFYVDTDNNEMRLPLESFLLKEPSPELSRWYDYCLDAKRDKELRKQNSSKKERQMRSQRRTPNGSFSGRLHGISTATRRKLPVCGKRRLPQGIVGLIFSVIGREKY